MTLILCFEALLFLLFTAIMFCTQIHSISVDETGIEQLKGMSANFIREFNVSKERRILEATANLPITETFLERGP